MNADPFDMGDEPALTPPPATPPEVIGQGAGDEPKKSDSQIRTRRPTPTPPDRSPPHSAEAEEHVIACCLLEGDAGATLQRATDAGLTPESFYFPACREVFATLLSMASRGIAATDATLIEEMGARLPGGLPWLMQVTGKVPTTAHAGYFIEKVRELSEKRTLIRNATGIVEAAYAGEDLAYLRTLGENLTPAHYRRGQLPAKPLPDFQLPPASDPSILIGNRWLSRGDIAILASTSGMGKSSLSLQAATHWALQLPLFGGFQTQRPLRSLIFQAEDGDGDIAEVFISLTHAMKLSPTNLAAVRERVLIVTDRIHRGLSFRAELARQIALHKPDLVWINPLLAFIGGDVNDSTDVGAFLREQLNSLNEPPQFAYIIVHHTAKPPKEKAQRQWNEVMYEMAGSADLTNAARAILSLQATQTEGEFTLVAAKRGIRAGLTKRVPQGAGYRQDPTATITVRHSKERMEVNGVSLPVIHWERGEDAAAPESIETKGHKKAVEMVEKFAAKIPDTAAGAKPLGMMHRDLKDRTELTYNGFKKVMLRAHEAGALIMVERPGLGACFYRPAQSRASNDD